MTGFQLAYIAFITILVNMIAWKQYRSSRSHPLAFVPVAMTVNVAVHAYGIFSLYRYLYPAL